MTISSHFILIYKSQQESNLRKLIQYNITITVMCGVIYKSRPAKADPITECILIRSLRVTYTYIYRKCLRKKKLIKRIMD